ncbi:MAG: TlpA family protein disulfide reductase [Flavobacteriales bacterium]|nr:TlpA family protein disulfide reductase [Flavobacteriales bacterium]MCB9447397.1 TlpA family protein disulfide reductase [Flavobacteriales bacterium]
MSKLRWYIFLIGIAGASFFYFRYVAKKDLPGGDLQLLDGSILPHASISNKVVVVNLWATWCPPCVAEIPALNQLKNAYASDDRVVFLAVSAEDPEKVKNFLSRTAFDFIQVDPSHAYDFNKGLSRVYPRTFVYDRSGKLVKTFTGKMEGEKLAELEGLIK